MYVPLSPLEFRDRAERLFGKKIGVIDGDKNAVVGPGSQSRYESSQTVKNKEYGNDRQDRGKIKSALLGGSPPAICGGRSDGGRKNPIGGEKPAPGRYRRGGHGHKRAEQREE